MCGDNECVVLYMHKSVLDVCIILHRTVILHSSPLMHNYSRNLTLDRLAQLLRNGQHLNPQEATHERYKGIKERISELIQAICRWLESNILEERGHL